MIYCKVLSLVTDEIQLFTKVFCVCCPISLSPSPPPPFLPFCPYLSLSVICSVRIVFCVLVSGILPIALCPFFKFKLTGIPIKNICKDLFCEDLWAVRGVQPFSVVKSHNCFKCKSQLSVALTFNVFFNVGRIHCSSLLINHFFYYRSASPSWPPPSSSSWRSSSRSARLPTTLAKWSRFLTRLVWHLFWYSLDIVVFSKNIFFYVHIQNFLNGTDMHPDPFFPLKLQNVGCNIWQLKWTILWHNIITLLFDASKFSMYLNLRIRHVLFTFYTITMYVYQKHHLRFLSKFLEVCVR